MVNRKIDLVILIGIIVLIDENGKHNRFAYNSTLRVHQEKLSVAL